MQEEVSGKSVALIISSAKMTEQVLDRAIRAYLDRKKQPKIYRGRQTLKQLAGQNAGPSAPSRTRPMVVSLSALVRAAAITWA